jgi:hypothetical protein
VEQLRAQSASWLHVGIGVGVVVGVGDNAG